MTRLSSDYLFRYTSDVATLCKMLRYGFRHNLWKESLPFSGEWQANFICCFCDILPSQAAYHANCYGKNALVLNREWGVRHNVSPVRYIHPSSVGGREPYPTLKFLHRSACEMEDHEQLMMVRTYLLIKRLNQAGKLPDGKFWDALAKDPSLQRKLEADAEAFGETLRKLPPDALLEVLGWLGVLFESIRDLHNELESRDAHLRAYEEDFISPTGVIFPKKILYDEREWRSVRFIEATADKSHLAVFEKAKSDGFLPSSYNLMFTPRDLQHVVVDSEAQKETVRQFVSANACLVGIEDMDSKLITFEELVSRSA